MNYGICLQSTSKIKNIRDRKRLVSEVDFLNAFLAPPPTRCIGALCGPEYVKIIISAKFHCRFEWKMSSCNMQNEDFCPHVSVQAETCSSFFMS